MKFASRRFVLWIVCVGCFLWAAPADHGEWQPIGPFGGDARSLAADPQDFRHLFIGTSNSEIYSSTDGGHDWRWLSEVAPRPDLVVGRLIVDPTSSNLLYAGAYTTGNGEGGGVFRSKDGGRTWQELPDIYGQSVRALTMSTVDPGMLVAGTLEGVFKTIDAGENWKRISPRHHEEIRNIESVALDPAEPDAVYAGTWHLPWKTADGGRTWFSIKDGILDDSDVFTITVDWSNHSTAYLGACSGIYRTDSAGVLWRKIQGIPFSARRTRAIRQDPQRPATVYAGTTEGLWKTEDGGKSWNHTTSNTLIVNDVLIDPRDSAHLFLATDRAGVLESRDGGHAFRPVNAGFSHRLIWRLIGTGTELIASVRHDKDFGGVFLSDDGVEWRSAERGLKGNDVLGLVRLPAGDLLAGTATGLFRYARARGVWQAEGKLLFPVKLPSGRSGMSSAPLNAEVADIAIAGGVVFAATDRGVLRSNDSGATWMQVSPGFKASLVAASPDVLAAFGAGEGLRISTDSGATWKAMALPGASRVNALVAAGHAVYTATDQGLFRSLDGGRSWEPHGRGIPIGPTYDIAVDPENPQRLFVGSGLVSDRIYVSHDGGETYKPLPMSGFTGRRPRRLTLGPGGKLYLASGYDGLFARIP